MSSNLTQKRLEQIQGLLYDVLIQDGYKPSEAFEQISTAQIEEYRDNVEVTYSNGVKNNFKIKYKSYLADVGVVPTK